MSPPVVKRQTTSRSGFLGVFSAFLPPARSASGLVGSLGFLLQVQMPYAAPHTYGGSTAMAMASAARRCPVLCARDTAPGPHTGLRNREAARVPCASEPQARGRGSPRHPGVPSAACLEAPERVSHHTPRAQGAWPLRSGAFTDAARPALQRARRRLPPGASREAPGAPAPLTTGGETWPDHPRFDVYPGQSRPGPADEPGPSRRCPCHAWAPSG
jgi:hypothetical protein